MTVEISLGKSRGFALLTKFLIDMMPTKLLWHKGAYEGEWVFWSQEASSNRDIRDRIVTSICLGPMYLLGDTLLQFRATKMIGGQTHLTTALQPFTLINLKCTNKKVNVYRKICVGSNLVVSDDVNIMDGGIIGRVFHNQLPEICPDLSYYSVTDYPQIDLVLSCGFKSILVLPVLESSQRCCVGVLELLHTSRQTNYGLYADVYNINMMLKSEHLETIDTWKIRTQIQDAYKGRVEKEIKQALRQVSKEYELTLACVWIRCTHIRSVNHDAFSHTSYHVNHEGKLLVFIPDMSFCSGRNRIPPFYYDASSYIPLNVGQGLVGKSALYRKPFLCRDVSQFRITQYPLVRSARKSQLAGCFAVCLRTISTGNHEYVVKFFLPRNVTNIGHLHTWLSSILTTLKEHLRTFEVVTQDLGNESFIEVDKFSFHKEFESLKEFPTVNTQVELEALQNREVLRLDHLIHHQLEIEDIHVSEQPER